MNDARIAALMLVVLLVSACGHEPVRRVPGPASSEATLPAGERAAMAAARQVGAPYRYGGADGDGFDCSGLVQFAYAEAGRRIPRTTAEQWRRLQPVREEALAVGDVLFFRIDGSISHVGMYLGDGRFVHAPSTGRQVSVAELNQSYYRRAFVRGGRPR